MKEDIKLRYKNIKSNQNNINFDEERPPRIQFLIIFTQIIINNKLLVKIDEFSKKTLILITH